jgi:hypothetical protein
MDLVMANFVEKVYIYNDTLGNITDKARYAWEQLMECVNTGIQLDNLYYAKNLNEMVGGVIPSAILTALVKRGLLHCDGKCEGKNVYVITTEIFDYYENVYVPTKKTYEIDVSSHFSRKG